jgi:tight adherence protein B
MTNKEKIKYYIAGFLLISAGGYVFYNSLIISALAGMLVFPLRKEYLKLKVKQRREGLCSQFRDLLYSISASFSAGRQMNEALKEGVENLKLLYDDKEPIIVELEHITKSVDGSRVSEDLMLKDFAYRSGIDEIINFADVYSICRTTGGDVGQIIMKSSEVLMDKMTIEKDIRTLTAQKKFEAKIISCMPFIIIIFLNLASPGYLDGMYHTAVGRVIMTIALLAIAISYYIMNIITEVKI